MTLLECTPHELELIKEAEGLLETVDQHGADDLDLDDAEDENALPEKPRQKMPDGFTFNGWRKEPNSLDPPKRYNVRQKTPKNFKFEGCSSWLKAG